MTNPRRDAWASEAYISSKRILRTDETEQRTAVSGAFSSRRDTSPGLPHARVPRSTRCSALARKLQLGEAACICARFTPVGGEGEAVRVHVCGSFAC